MAQRPQAPRQGNVASTAAVLVLASLFAAPVLAASDRGILCDRDQGATLDIAEHELTVVSHEAGDSNVAEPVATTWISSARSFFRCSSSSARFTSNAWLETQPVPAQTSR